MHLYVIRRPSVRADFGELEARGARSATIGGEQMSGSAGSAATQSMRQMVALAPSASMRPGTKPPSASTNVLSACRARNFTGSPTPWSSAPPPQKQAAS